MIIGELQFIKFFTLPLDLEAEEVLIIVDTLARRLGVGVIE